MSIVYPLSFPLKKLIVHIRLTWLKVVGESLSSQKIESCKN